MRWLLLVLALTGCRQIFGIEDPRQVLGADAPLAKRDSPFGDARADSMVASSGTCNVQDTTLVGCWEFEADLRDSSANQLDAADPGVVTYAVGKFGLAVDVNGTDVVVGEDTRLDLPAVTMEAWINPKHLPMFGTRMGIVDNNDQYGLFLSPNGVRCLSGTTTIDLLVVVPTNTWTHVACTSDGVHATAWSGGTKSMGGTMPIPMTGLTGLSLGSDNPPGQGSRFDGLLDDVRLYSAVRSDTEICTDAGVTC